MGFESRRTEVGPPKATFGTVSRLYEGQIVRQANRGRWHIRDWHLTERRWSSCRGAPVPQPVRSSARARLTGLGTGTVHKLKREMGVALNTRRLRAALVAPLKGSSYERTTRMIGLRAGNRDVPSALHHRFK